MATVLTLTANTLVDCLATGPVVPGKVNRVESFEPVAGGKGLNVGRVLARFGHRVLAAGFAGGWSGRILDDLVVGNGMEPVLVTTKARTRIGFNVVGSAGNIAFLENGFPVEKREASHLVEAISEKLSEVDLVMICGSVPDHSCDDLFARVLDACAAASVPCWLDSYGPALQLALEAEHPPVLAKANKDEFGNGQRWERCPEVHVTDGPGEIRVRTAGGQFTVVPPRLEEKSAIGSGDCYFAGLAHARLSGMSLADQLRWAAAAGAANAAMGATARLGLEDVVPWLVQVQISKRLDS